MDDLDHLYQDIILDHYKHPRNRSALRDEDVMADEENPMCGDQLRLTASLQDGRLVCIRYDGKGCAISQASASMMTEALEGRTIDDARQVIHCVVAALRGETDFDPAWSDDIVALSGVKKYALRVKCATLAWHGMEKVLDRLS